MLNFSSIHNALQSIPGIPGTNTKVVTHRLLRKDPIRREIGR